MDKPHRFFLTLLVLLTVVTHAALADYGDVPPQQKMDVHLGIDWRWSTQNFAYDGIVEDLVYTNRAATLNDWIFWVEPEYGVAEDWSVGARAGFLLGSLTDRNDLSLLAAGNGLTDAWVYSKWQFMPGSNALGVEAAMKAPLGTSRVETVDGLVTGDGAFDLALKLHGSSRIGIFRLFLTPGMLFRFNGYATALTAEAAFQLEYIRGYVRGFARLMYSLSENQLYDSRIELHDAYGTGGSYTRLAGSPTSFGVGGKLGVLILPRFALEAHVTQNIFGQRAPVITQVGVSAVLGFDFIEPKKSVRIRELPFDPDEE